MDVMEKLVALCKRRGIIFRGSELYGGLNGTWDLGPVGSLLAKNIKEQWLNSIVFNREDIVLIDSSILHNTKTWEASGHITSFTDPLVECKICHQRFREDHKKEMEEHVANVHPDKKADWTDVKQFNLMFKTYVGPLEDESSKTYLRPETAQGIFINFENVLNSTRIKIPFGIAQIGKGFRNEITTGNFLFRVREFEMMELEFFTKPDESQTWFKYWVEQREKWYLDLGIKKENIKVQALDKKDIAHYSKGTSEIWYNWPFMGFGELEGIANRGDYDLKAHGKYSGKSLEYSDEVGEKFIPYVIEPSVGVGRAMLAFLIDAYHEEEKRIVLKLHPKLAPNKIAVFPLVSNKEEIVNKARSVWTGLKQKFSTAWDDRGNIGKRYLSQDEIGTPWCATVDYQTLEDDTVTVRDRDTTAQERIKISDLSSYFASRLV